MPRTYPPRPILAVGGLVIRNGAMLLIKRGKEPGLGRWSIPGGAVEVGETLAEGLTREMMEEVGLPVRVGPLVEIIERIFRDPQGRVQYHYVIHDYICINQTDEPISGSDAAEAIFAAPDEWPQYELGSQAIRILTKAMSMAEKL